MHKENISKQRTQIRDIFGIIPIPLYIRNYECKISCIYCPQVPNIPKSYLKNEDTLKARNMNYDPELQLDYWLKLIKDRYPTAKPVKLEIIILGGTFSDLSHEYRTSFFKKMYDKLNGFKSNNIYDAARFNGAAKFRACIINIETRPDTIDIDECNFLRLLGVSKVELGVQSLFDDVLSFSGRPYTHEDIIRKTKLLREYGFKIGYHIMLNMPKSNMELDSILLSTIINDRRYIPDFIKIYPLTLIQNKSHQTIMWKLFSEGSWKPYDKSQLLQLLYDFKRNIPEYMRIQRIQRQFDEDDYLYKKIEFRNNLKKMLKKNKEKCSCIRCQEIALFNSKYCVGTISDCIFSITPMNENNYYLAFKSSIKGYLLGYLKLYLDKIAIIREIKVVGKSAMVGQCGQLQGKGIGSYLLNKAEQFVLQKGYGELFINASPGVRLYFLKKKYIETQSLLKKIL